MKNYKVITICTKSGKSLLAFEGDSITTEIQKKGEYDANTLSSIRDVLDTIKPRTSLDISANIGNHALVIAGYSERLFAFEPVGFIFDLLQKNIDKNQFFNVKVVNAGLSDVAGIAEIFIPENGNLGCSSLEISDAQGVNLNITTLIGDEYFESYGISDIDFIKIDVEGHEAIALSGLEDTILKCQPLVLLEYRNPRAIEMFAQQNLFNSLFSGYSIFSLSSISSKKVHGRNLASFAKRIFYKIASNKWCLSGFDPNKKYSNIYLVPSRYESHFKKFTFLKAA